MSGIDRNTAEQIGAACKEALAEVAEKFGLTVTLRGGSFDPSVGTFSPKIVFAVADAAKNEFAEYAAMFLLEPEDFGREFTEFPTGGRTFKICGIKPRATKRPILATEVVSGKRYAFPSEFVAKQLHPEGAVA
jgi:hypothetical protein